MVYSEITNLTNPQSKLIREMVQKNYSQRAIAAELGIPRSTLSNRIKRINAFDAYMLELAEKDKESYVFIAEDDLYGKWLRAMKNISKKT